MLSARGPPSQSSAPGALPSVAAVASTAERLTDCHATWFHQLTDAVGHCWSIAANEDNSPDIEDGSTVIADDVSVTSY